MQNYGYIYEDRRPEDYVFGANQIQADILQPDGDWSAHLPPDELQSRPLFDSYACVTFGTFNAVEMILHRKYGTTDNYSDRYLAKISGTEYQKGNSPQTVAEYLRKVGAPMEKDWPFDDTVGTFAQFYAALPSWLSQLADEFPEHFLFKHDYVNGDPASMMEALKYSPLGVAVHAWTEQNGLYIRPKGAPDVHWCVIYKAVEGKKWLVLDTYDNTRKELAWDFGFNTVKRYHIELQPETKSILATLADALNAALMALSKLFKQPTVPVTAPQAPQEQPEPVTPLPEAPVAKYDWSTPDKARHSVRVICDEMGLTVEQKNTMCATIGGESGWIPSAINRNKDPKTGAILSTDYGICQINDYWHIGPRKSFPSAQYVLDNPEACVRWMARLWKSGQRHLWMAYNNGRYKKFL